MFDTSGAPLTLRVEVMHEMFRFAHATIRSSASSAGKFNDTVECTIRVEDVVWYVFFLVPIC
jgi:hypothetical protein